MILLAESCVVSFLRQFFSLAHRTASLSMIGYWHDGVVCLSVRLSVYDKCTVPLMVCVGVESCTVMFLGLHFLFTSSDTFAIGCIV